MSTWPSVLSTISSPAATDKLNAPSHSGIESNQNDAISKLETFIGTQASAVGTLIYDIRATASDGGGHVQSANKGGTGQTAYTKGDVLIAQSASVLTKLAVGVNDQALIADSTQATGVKWAGVATATAIQNQTYTYVRASVMSGSVYGVKLSENPSILSDGLGLVIKFPVAPTSSPIALQVFTGNGSVAALIKKTDLTNPLITDIPASMIGILEFDSVSSVFQIINPREYIDFASAQSVVGVKTFTNLPQSPATPSVNVDLATKTYVDTTAASFAVWKNGTTTKMVDDASTTQTIAHGLGVTPKFVRVRALGVGTGGTPQGPFAAVSVYNGTTQSSQAQYAALSVATDFRLGDLETATNVKYQIGVITFNATNISIDWTKTSTPSGTYQILWEAYY